MSGYGYGPPPPPPSASAAHPVYGHPNAVYSLPGHARGGGTSSGRGRGGQYPRPRGDYVAPAAHSHYDYPGPPYQPQGPAPYGPSVPHPVAYQPHSHPWPPEHAHSPPPPPPNAHPHAPVPMAPTGYQPPNYAPQPYPPSQYPPQPAYGPSQQYASSYRLPAQQNMAHWTPQASPQQAHHPHSRGRGGYSDRGGLKHHHLSASQRQQGYDHEPVATVGGSFGQPYAPDPRLPHYAAPTQYPYPGPPAPYGSTRRPDGHHGHHQNQRRGRGGGPRDGAARARGGGSHNHHHHHHQQQHHQQQHQQHVGDKPRQAHKQPSNSDAKLNSDPPSAGKKKKRKTNTLGLTPGMEAESEDDEGEEKTLVELIGPETLQIDDIAAFLAERKKNFPTRARVEARKAAELARKDEAKAAELEKQADRLRKQLRKVESSIKRKREQGDEGDEMRESEGLSDDEKPEVMSSRTRPHSPAPPAAQKADISRHCKYYSTGGTCGKKGKCRFVHDPEVREAAMKERQANDGRMTIQQRLILNDKEQEDLTILQSIHYLREKGLMQQPAAKATANGSEQETETRAQAGAAPKQGKLDVESAGTPKQQAKEKQKQKETKSKKKDNHHAKAAAPIASSGTSLLPAAPASLPPPPPHVKTDSNPARRHPPPPSIPAANSSSSQGTTHYQGWLLQPYGSSNGKQSQSDDLP